MIITKDSIKQLIARYGYNADDLTSSDRDFVDIADVYDMLLTTLAQKIVAVSTSSLFTEAYGKLCSAGDVMPLNYSDFSDENFYKTVCKRETYIIRKEGGFKEEVPVKTFLKA